MANTRGLAMGAAVHFGWDTLRKHPGFVVGTTLAAWVVPAIIKEGSNLILHHDGQRFAMSIIGAVVTATLYLGLFKIYLRFRDGETPVIENLFDGVQRFYVWIGATIVASIAVLIGLCLLIVPGIVLLIRLMFVGFVIVDERAGPIDAIQRSWDITRGYTFDLFLFFLLLCGLNILGAVCLIVGLFVTVPMTGLALAHVYRALKPRATTASATTVP